MSETLTPQQAAEALGLDRHTIVNLIASGDLEARIEDLGDGRLSYHIPTSAISDFKAKRAQTSSDDLLSITQAMHILGLKYPVVHRMLGKPGGLVVGKVVFNGRQRRRFVTRASVEGLKEQIDAMKAAQTEGE
jgi:excisionase family DNA binding protein